METREVIWYHFTSRVSFLFNALSNWYPHLICNKTAYLIVVTNIVNHSLDCAIMPGMLKIAQIRPRLEKASLDDEIFKTFGLCQIFSFISKGSLLSSHEACW